MIQKVKLSLNNPAISINTWIANSISICKNLFGKYIVRLTKHFRAFLLSLFINNLNDSFVMCFVANEDFKSKIIKFSFK